MSLRLLVSHKPSWIKRIIPEFPLKSFPRCSWSQQQIDFWMRGRWSSLYYCSVKLSGRGFLKHLHKHFISFLLFWPLLVLFRPSSSAPASPVFCLLPLLTTFVVFSPTTLSKSWWTLSSPDKALELPVHWTFPADPGDVWWNFFYGWDLLILLSQISFLIFSSMSTSLSQRLFRLRLTSFSQVFADHCFLPCIGSHPVFGLPALPVLQQSPLQSTNIFIL